jgi:SAM-dependent methyltransferase
MSRTEAERYWDARARENAIYFVDNEVDYQKPDTEAFWRRGEEVVDEMLSAVGLTLRGDEAVLDIGCGIGRLTRALSARVGRVYGLDVSSEMLARAHAQNADAANIEWLHGDGVGLGVVGDASVDGCFSHVVFQHIPDPKVTLGYVCDMGRVLRPGGWALFQVSTDPGVHRPRGGGWRARVRRLVRRDDENRAWWGSPVDPAALRRAAEEGGLDIERILDEGTQFTTVFARRRL